MNRRGSNPVTVIKHTYEKGGIDCQEISNYTEDFLKDLTYPLQRFYLLTKFNCKDPYDLIPKVLPHYILDRYKGKLRLPSILREEQKFKELVEYSKSSEVKDRVITIRNRDARDFILNYRNKVIEFEIRKRKEIMENKSIKKYPGKNKWINNQVKEHIIQKFGKYPNWIHQSESTIRRKLVEIYKQIEEANESLRLRPYAHQQEVIDNSAKLFKQKKIPKKLRKYFIGDDLIFYLPDSELNARQRELKATGSSDFIKMVNREYAKEEKRHNDHDSIKRQQYKLGLYSSQEVEFENEPEI